MTRAWLALSLLALDGSTAAMPPRTLEIENLGAASVTLRLQRADGVWLWGPYELAAHEVLRMSYCPCASLNLELAATRRPKALRYLLFDQTALLLSEDRWSAGDPIVRRDDTPTTCAAHATCAGPLFHVGP